MSIEEEENKIFKDYAIQKVWSIKNLRISYIIEEGKYKWMKIGHGHSICLLIFNQWLRCNASIWIDPIKYHLFDRSQNIMIKTCGARRRRVAYCMLFNLYQALEMLPHIPSSLSVPSNPSRYNLF